MQIKDSIVVCLLVIITGCSSNEKRPDDSGKLSVHKAAEVLFRRSYAAIQFRDMPKKEFDSIQASNPSPGTNTDSAILIRFKECGLTDKEYGLIRSAFSLNKAEVFELIGNGEKINCKIDKQSNDTDVYNLIITNNHSQQTKIEIEGHYGGSNADIQYLLLDVIPGGFKEVIILNEYYIMNGDNSIVYIYEINKTDY